MIQCSGRRRLRVELKFACAGCALMGLPQPPNKSEHARNSTQEQAFSASCKRSGESSKHSQARILTLTLICHTISQTGYVDHRWQRGNADVHQNMNGRGQLARTYHEADSAFLEYLEASSNTIANDVCVCMQRIDFMKQILCAVHV